MTFFDSNIYKNIQSVATPFYLYKKSILQATCEAIKTEIAGANFHVHYALKANNNDALLQIIQSYGFGADCVSGNEIKHALKNNFSKDKIVLAGVGKSDKEMDEAIDADIFSLNIESIEEIEVINQLAANKNKTVNVALRINPNVIANTHAYITTGLETNKNGILFSDLDIALLQLKQSKFLKLIGLHFHIGSQINELEPFRNLCTRINQVYQMLLKKGIQLQHINVGGGLGINYEAPDTDTIPNFKNYFDVYKKHLDIDKNIEIHFELGRSMVAQCGALITKVLIVKKNNNLQFLVLDAGMTELLRPALYQAYHKIENLSAQFSRQDFALQNVYDVVGPICESSDCFGKAVNMPSSVRNDLVAIRSTGAYGAVMSSGYNMRDRVEEVVV
jgi:diaminopimelate decarboxylase